MRLKTWTDKLQRDARSISKRLERINELLDYELMKREQSQQ